MNILITGGLLGIAVVAVIGAILLSLGEKQPARQPKDNISGNLDKVAQAPRPERVVPPPRPAQITLPENVEIPASLPVTPLLAEPTSMPTNQKREPLTNLADLHGQVQEIAGEVRALAQHASELEQRLHHLSTLLDDNQHNQSHQPDTSPPGQFYTPQTGPHLR